MQKMHLFASVCAFPLLLRVFAEEIRQQLRRTHAQRKAHSGQLIVRHHAGVVLDLAEHLLIHVYPQRLKLRRKLALRHPAPDAAQPQALGNNVLIVVEGNLFHSVSPRLYNVFYLTLAYILS